MNSGLTEFEEFLKPALAEYCGQANVEVYYHAYKACVEVLIHNERILTGVSTPTLKHLTCLTRAQEPRGT